MRRRNFLAPLASTSGQDPWREVELYNAITGSETGTSFDENGHGTHVASIAISSRTSNDGLPMGIAPNADPVSVMAFAAHGNGSYGFGVDGYLGSNGLGETAGVNRWVGG